MIINLVLFFIPKRQEIYRLYLIKKRKKLAYMRLNSKTVIGTISPNGVKEIELVPLSCGLLSFSHPYDGCALYLFSTYYDTSAGHIYSIKENPRINSVTLNGNKLIMNTRINFTFCCYVYTYR